MGDPLSAAAVVLSLPGVFMSCVQCFELIQRGRNMERDTLILTTKFSNQQLRFTKWGEACGFGSPAGYHQGLDRPELKPNIERTFQSIKLLLDSGLSVSKTYEEDSTENDGIVLPHAATTRWSWTAVKKRLSGSRTARGTKNATKWALSDKTKLDEIVRHLSDLIRDLEDITADLGVPERQRYLVQYEIQSISDTETLELIEASRLNSDDMISETASVRLQDLYRGNATSARQPESIMDILSVPDTTFTTETYATAPEEMLPDQEAPIVEVAQHSRIMKNLLGTARFASEERTDYSVDTARVGTMINRLSLDTFDKALQSHSNLFHDTDHVLPAQARRRIMKQLLSAQEWTTVQHSRYYNLHPIRGNLRYILGSFEGPPNSSYEDGLFHVLIYVQNEYPFKPPKCFMVTKAYHPNINSDGEVCIDILQKQWSPPMSLETVLISIISILDDPGLEDPLVPEIAETYIRNRKLYDENARAYTQKYAQEVCLSPETIERFVGMCKGLR